MPATLTAGPPLQFAHLAIGYGKSRVVGTDLNGALQAGRLTCLIGRNGAGKSTLLRTLGGLQPPLPGREKADISLLGRPLNQYGARQLARAVAVVLTERVPDPYITALEVVHTGRYAHTGTSGRLHASDHRAVSQALALTETTALASRPMRALSDGEQQRVMMARALAQEAPVILLDEPTAFLDLSAAPAHIGLLRRLAHRRGKAVLLTCHDVEAALHMADMVWLLHEGCLTCSPPRQLADSGAIARCFGSAYLRFDPREMRFIPQWADGADGGRAE